MLLNFDRWALNYADIQGLFLDYPEDKGIHHDWITYYNYDVDGFKFTTLFQERRGQIVRARAYCIDRGICN